MKKINYLLLILLTFSFLVFINYQILKHSQVARVYDESARLCFGLKFYDLLFKDTDIPAIKKLDVLLTLDDRQAHPHFFEFMEAISWRLLEVMGIRDEDPMILIVNALFLLVLLLSVYGIGSIIYSQKVGFLAALVVSMFPFVFAHSRVAMLDFPLMCMVSLSFLLLLKTKGFQVTFYSICSGIVFGLSQLTKEAAILFIFPSLIYYFVRSYIISPVKKKVLLNFILTLALFLIIAGSVYLRIINRHAFETYFALPFINHHTSVFFYLQYFIDCIGPFILILSLPLCLGYLVNLKKREKFFLYWFFVPLILFSIFPNKSARFIMPILPAFSLIVVQEIFSNNLLRKVRETCGFLLVSFSILQYAFFNYGVLDYSRKYRDAASFEAGIPHSKQGKYMPVLFTMLDIFKKEMSDSRGFKKVLFLFNIGVIHCPLEYRFKLSRLPFSVVCPMVADEVNIVKKRINCDKQILTAGYVIDKPGDTSGIRKHNYNLAEDLRRSFAKYKNHFRVIAEIKVFDGSSILIYKRIAY